ncbi:MAG: hypothetical protein U0350_07260 [Caldilineaceae bacterium]
MGVCPRQTAASLLHDYAQPDLYRQAAQAMEAVYGEDELYAEPLATHWLAAEEQERATLPVQSSKTDGGDHSRVSARHCLD